MKMFQKHLLELGAGVSSAGIGIGALFLYQRAKMLWDNTLSKEARKCFTIIDPRSKRLCMLLARIKASQVELQEIRKIKSQCKDSKCREKADKKYRDLDDKIYEMQQRYRKMTGQQRG